MHKHLYCWNPHSTVLNSAVIFAVHYLLSGTTISTWFLITRIFHVRFEVFTAVTMKNGVFWDVSRVALVGTDVVSEELSSSIIRVTRIGELGTTVTVLVTANVVRSSLILVTLIMEELSSFETSVLTRATWHNIPEDAILHGIFQLLAQIW
jgi:hypothetical protein